jgi:hypothetical protein
MSLLTVVSIIHWLAGVIVVAEALNKLERTTPFARGLTPHQRLVEGLKALAWALLALGGAGAVITPLVHLEAPTLQDCCVMLGFATLIVRTRVKEG